MVEHCPDHSQLMEDVGVIKGEVKALVTGQEKIFNKLNDLTVSSAVEQTKIKPLYWVLGVIALIIITSATSSLVSHIWPDNKAQAQQTKENK